MSLLICRFQVPRNLNDGTPVPLEFFDLVERVLDRQFGGYTDLGIQMGCWHGQKEESRWYKVFVSVAQVETVRAIVREIGIELGQKEMAIEISADTAELVAVPEPGQQTKFLAGGSESQ